jgi:uncharacterized membrane protein
MKNLIVVGFHGKHRAAEVLDQLVQLHEAWVIDLADAVAVYRRDNGTLRLDESLTPTEAEGVGVGASLGMIAGAMLAAPFTAGASAAAAATALGVGAVSGGTIGAVAGGTDAYDWKEEFGISEDFVREVGGMIQPGDSAVFALVRAGDPDEVSRRFAGYGGTILRTTLDPVTAVKVQERIRTHH